MRSGWKRIRVDSDGDGLRDGQENETCPRLRVPDSGWDGSSMADLIRVTQPTRVNGDRRGRGSHRHADRYTNLSAHSNPN